MIQTESVCRRSRQQWCTLKINVLRYSGGSHRRYASVGDIIKVTVKKQFHAHVLKGDVMNAVVVRTKFSIRRP